MNIVELIIVAFIEMIKYSAKHPGDSPEQSKTINKNFSPSELRQLDPKTFEDLIGRIWDEQGYDYTLTNDGADGGLDLILESDKEIVGVQAKCYDKGNKVGAKVVRETVGAANRINADRSIVATSSSFTNPAEEEAKHMKIQLYDGSDISNLATRYISNK